MASVLGVTSAAMRRITDSTKETSSASQRWYSLGTPHEANSESVRSVVEVEATISASVLLKRTVERYRFGSALRCCRMPAALLPCSARNLTLSRPTEVSAVSVPLAAAATKKQMMSTISSNDSVAFTAGGLSEELADAPVLVYPDDRLREQRCNRQHREWWPELFGGNGDRVSHDDLIHVCLLESLDCVSRKDRMRGRDQDLACSLMAK